MSERSIALDAPTVRAILDGKQTQIRTPVKPQPIGLDGAGRPQQMTALAKVTRCAFDTEAIPSPLGEVGDLVWVKEPWRPWPTGKGYDYAADNNIHWGNATALTWRSSRSMSRQASRLLLEIRAVRVERLHEISYDDVLAHGTSAEGVRVEPTMNGKGLEVRGLGASYARKNFIAKWEADHGEGSWVSDPFVWVFEFRKR